jgi:hypothetical protein
VSPAAQIAQLIVDRPDLVVAVDIAVIFSFNAHHPVDRQCIGCGCTDGRACPGGCSWPRPDVDLCSVCMREALES